MLGYERVCHICLSTDAGPISALGSLGDISRKEELNFSVLIKTVYETSQKVTADLGMPRSGVLGNQ